MSPINTRENVRLVTYLNGLDHISHFVSEIATAVLAGGENFESVWNIANRVYERHCSPKVRFMPRTGFDRAGSTALSA